METQIKKEFDPVEYFRVLQQKLSDQLDHKTLYQQKEYLKLMLSGKIELIQG